MSNAAETLGSKFTCFKCTCKFYDLGVEVPLCPRCGADQREDPNPDARTAFLASLRRSPSRKRKKKAAPVGPAPTIDSTPSLEADDDLLDDDFDEDGAPAKKKAQADSDEDDE